MFVGHYSAAFVAKALDSRIPLWALFLAVQLVDVVWALLVLGGVEKVRLTEGFMEASPLDLYYMPFSHSLAATLAWSAGTALLARYVLRAEWRVAALVGAAVASHWLLDLLVHAPDLPLYDDSHKMGLGLWNHALASFALEIGLLAAAVGLYVRAVRPVEALRRSVVGGTCVLIAVQAYHTFGSSAGSVTQIVTLALVAFLAFTAIAGWLERRYD